MDRGDRGLDDFAVRESLVFGQRQDAFYHGEPVKEKHDRTWHDDFIKDRIEA